MTYLSDLHTYLHKSSLLIQAYPDARITTKYSLPRKLTKPPKTSTTATTDTTSQSTPREKREPSAVLTLKTFHPETGICLKYRTDKAQEVGRLMTGLGRLAKGEIIEIPSVTSGAGTVGVGDKMDVDEKTVAEAHIPSQIAAATSQPPPTPPQQQPQQTGGSGGGNKKKKKGKK